MSDCKTCHGTGSITITCRICKGTGWVGGRHGGEICCGGVDEAECPECNGTGTTNEEDDE